LKKEKIKPEVENALQDMYFGCIWCRGSDSGIDSKNVRVEALFSHYTRRREAYNPVKHVSEYGGKLEFCSLKCKNAYLKSEKEIEWSVKVVKDDKKPLRGL